MAKSKSEAAAIADGIEAVQLATLNLLDRELSDWQRQKADEIYELTSQLEEGEVT
jgi:hypothetical protein